MLPTHPAVSRPALVLLSLLAAVASGCQATSNQKPDAPAAAPATPKVDLSAPPAIQKFTEGGVTIHSFIAPDVSEAVNSQVIELPRSVVVVDTQMLRPYARQLRAYVDGLKKPISHVIISHAHPDHYFGLEFFQDVPTFAFQDTVDRMHKRSKGHQAGHKAREGDDVIDTIVYPRTVLQPGTLTVDGVDLVLEELRGGEDVTQMVIRIPQARTLVLQDLVAGQYHAFTGTLMLDQWTATLRQLQTEVDQGGYLHILPGHGQPGGPGILGDTLRYIAKAKEVFADAKTPEEYVQRMRQAFPGWGGGFIIEVSAQIWDRDRQQ